MRRCGIYCKANFLFMMTIIFYDCSNWSIMKRSVVYNVLGTCVPRIERQLDDIGFRLQY